MNYVGKKVFHKAKYGMGTIIAQSQDGTITVLFATLPETKSFAAPACFSNFLQLLDENAAKQAAIELHAYEERVAVEKVQKEQALYEKLFENQLQSSRSKRISEKKATVPYYTSLDDFFNDQERLITSELVFLRQNGGKKQKLVDGHRAERKNGIYIYTFESDSESNYPDDTPISLWQSDNVIPAIIVNCEEFTLTIATPRDLGEKISQIEFSAEPWKLLQFLIERLKSLKTANSPIASSLILEGRKFVQFNKKILTGQENAIRLSFSQPISFIWGPPGTGKTETLAKIALLHMAKGYRVLMLSYSNVAVDAAIKRVFNKSEQQTSGIIVRYGYPRDKWLLHHEYLTSYNLVLSSHSKLNQERITLIEDRRHLLRTSSEYAEIGIKLAQIRKQMQSEERKAVSKAQFIATTVSKAIADKTLYEDKFDTVIFDEVSMAYIPQIIFSAGLATKHFVCMGDFSQLPPIVQSSNISPLNADIFHFCGIADAVHAGHAHQWLCMLDTQYRMHPEIAGFASEKMYHGLLKTAPYIEIDRQPVVNSSPMRGKSIGLYDLSGMMSVCLKTADQSRINVLSAMISMAAAIKAAKTYEIGVISPYNAQSRLLHAISRDIAENNPELHKIVCSTVHQFQGSEQDIMIFDAVDCYRMPYPGMLLTSMTNDYANRLYNVALTRAKGKFISVINVNYMLSKNLSQSLMLRQMIEATKDQAKVIGEAVFSDCNNHFMQIKTDITFNNSYLNEIMSARSEVLIDIPSPLAAMSDYIQEIVSVLNFIRRKGRKVVVRTNFIDNLPVELKPFASENRFIANPITLIDRRIVWYGMPHSGAIFISEGQTIPTRYRPIIRFEGKHFSQALYGFLEMSRT